MRKTEIATKTSGRKPSEIVALIAAIVLIATVVCAVIFGSFIPRADKIAVADDSRFTSIAATDRDEYFYSTSKGNIYRIGGKDDELEQFDLKAAIAEDTSGKFKDLQISDIRSLHMEPGSEYLWVATNSKQIIQLSDKDGKLSLVDYVDLAGEYSTMVEHKGTLYVINRYMSFYQIGSYSVDNLSGGRIADGYLYNRLPGNVYIHDDEEIYEERSVELSLMKNCSMLSVEVIEEDEGDFLYILYTDGLIRMSTDLSMNRWEDELSAVIPARVAELVANEAYRASVREALLDIGGYNKDKKYTEDELNGNPQSFEDEVALFARRDACAEYSKEIGITIYDYNESVGTVHIKRSAFDKNKYCRYAPVDISYCGGAYDAEADAYYIIGNDGIVYKFDRDQLPEADLSVSLGVEEIEGIQLAGTPNVSGTFFFSDVTRKGYVIYANSNQMSLIDFATMTMEFTTTANFNIRGLIQNPSSDRIFYVYYNDNEAEIGHLLFETLAIGEQNNEGTWSALTTISIILAIMAGVTLAFALLCMFKKGFSEKFQEIMRGFVKQWGIYSCILAAMVLLVTFCYYPAIGSIRLSLFDYTRDKPAEIWNNFAHYKTIFTTAGMQMFGNMLFFLFFDLFLALAPPLIFAFFLTIMRNRQVSGVIRTLLFIPGIIPGVATTLIWKTGIYGSYGVLNRLIGLFTDETITFLGATSMSRWSLVLMGFPFVGSYLIFYGAMMNVPDSYYEAAELDGITVRKRFFYIDIPLIFAQIKYVIIMTFIASAQNFGRTYMIFGTSVDAAGLKTPIHELYVQIQVHGNYGIASAYATVLFVFLFIATAINMRMQQKDNEV
jgi:ABC-type sugar transport system permease subunit